MDEHGRVIPLSPEEQKARADAIIRALRAIHNLPDNDPPDTLERLMKSLQKSEEVEDQPESFVQALQRIRSRPDNDPPDTMERMMRGIDENRPPGRKLFEGYY